MLSAVQSLGYEVVFEEPGVSLCQAPWVDALNAVLLRPITQVAVMRLDIVTDHDSDESHSSALEPRFEFDIQSLLKFIERTKPADIRICLTKLAQGLVRQRVGQRTFPYWVREALFNLHYCQTALKLVNGYEAQHQALTDMLTWTRDLMPIGRYINDPSTYLLYRMPSFR